MSEDFTSSSKTASLGLGGKGYELPVYSGTIGRTWPVHVTHDIPRQPYLLDTRDPRVHVMYKGKKEMTV